MLANHPVAVGNADFHAGGSLLITGSGAPGIVYRTDERAPISVAPWGKSTERRTVGDTLWMNGDKTLEQWTFDGQLRAKKPLDFGAAFVTMLAPWAKGQALIGLSSGAVTTYDVDKGEEAGQLLQGHDDALKWRENDVTEDGNKVVWLTPEGALIGNHTRKLWKLNLEDGTGLPKSLRWSPDSKSVAVYTDGEDVFIWRPDDGIVKKVLSDAKLTKPYLAWLPESKSVLTFRGGKLVELGLDGTVKRTVDKSHMGHRGIELSPDGSLVLLKDQLMTYPGLERVEVASPYAPTAIAVHPTRPLIAIGELDGGVRVFDWEFRATVWRSDGDKAHHLCWSPDGDKLAASMGGDGLQIYTVEGDLELTRKVGSGAKDGVSVQNLYCEGPKLMANINNVWEKEVTGSLQWSPDERFVMVSGKGGGFNEPDHWTLFPLMNDKVLRLPWPKSKFGPDPGTLHIIAPNGESAVLNVDAGKCDMRNVADFDPKALPTGPVRVVAGAVPSLGFESGDHLVHVHADDSGLAAVDSLGQFWAEPGAEHLLAIWHEGDWRNAKRFSTEEVKNGRHYALWSPLSDPAAYIDPSEPR